MVSEGYDAIMHRFMHVYDERTTFWYGAFEIAISAKEFQAAYPLPGADMNMHVVFPDGMGGRVHCWNLSAESGYVRFAGSCICALGPQNGFLQKPE